MASRAVASAWASCVVASLGLSGAATYFMRFLELFDNVLGLYSPGMQKNAPTPATSPALAEALQRVSQHPGDHKAYQQLSAAYAKEHQADLALAAALQAIARK